MESTASGRGGYWLETQSAEYDLVKYHLVAATQKIGVVEKLNVWKIVNPELQYRFEKRSSGMMRLQSWYGVDSCVGVNNLENVCSLGFRQDPNQPVDGLVIPVGIIPSDGESLLQQECCYLLLDVAVGRSFVYDGNLNNSTVPQGYDSLYIPPQPLDRNRDGKFSLQEYQNAANFDFRTSNGYNHKYFVGDFNQACPKYIVRFQLQKMRPGRIPDLDIEDAQFVDPITLQPADRSAASSGAFDKRMVSLDAAFSQALEDMGKIQADPTASAKSLWIQKQLVTVEDKVREINLNYAEVSEAIQEAAAQAQRRLQDLVRQKLELCLSLEIELRRQTEQVEWLDGVLQSELQRVQTAVHDAPVLAIKRKLMLRFLKLWKQHTLHRNALSRSKPHELQALGSLHPDLRVQPDIKIFVDPFFASTSVSSAQTSSNTKPTSPTDVGNEEHELVVSEFAQRASDHNYFNAPLQSTHPYLAAPVRALIDQEMSNIQKMMSSTAREAGLQLPASITGQALGGGGLHQPLLSMHAVLNMLRSIPPPPTAEPAADRHPEALESQEQLLHAFVNSVVTSNASTLVTAVVPREASQAPSEMMSDSPETVRQQSPPQSPSVQESAHQPAKPPAQLQPVPAPVEELQPAILSSAQAPPTLEMGGFAQVEMTIPQLKQAILPFRNLYMSDLSAKKIKQLQIRMTAGVEDQGFRSLDASRILSHSGNETQNLYYCLPFFSKAPALKLIYSTLHHARSLDELYQRTMKHRNPTVVLIRSGEFRFGAYLSHSPMPTCSWTGSPACFLFSLTLNMKIPYHARQVPSGTKLLEPMAVYGQDDRLFIGNGDLTIDAAIVSGTSEAENCYGLGLEEQSAEAMCLLAGAPAFRIDELEVWTITP